MSQEALNMRTVPLCQRHFRVMALRDAFHEYFTSSSSKSMSMILFLTSEEQER